MVLAVIEAFIGKAFGFGLLIVVLAVVGLFAIVKKVL